eukprot:333089-Chlamydomonas_euryale.AAC.1
MRRRGGAKAPLLCLVGPPGIHTPHAALHTPTPPHMCSPFPLQRRGAPGGDAAARRRKSPAALPCWPTRRGQNELGVGRGGCAGKAA